MSWQDWNEDGDYGYVSVDARRRLAAAAAKKLEKKGKKLSPVKVAGRNLTNTFWGQAWCRNLESYSDYESRLPRGRSYARNGAVIDLQIERGVITALVSGQSVYDVKIRISALDKEDWREVKEECLGKVGSLIDLLQGKLAGPVMEIITRKEGGLFPKPKEIRLDCSCPDYADMCKHVAATLYGVGVRLDESPELLFALRAVDHLELIAETTQNLAKGLTTTAVGAGNTLDDSSLSDIFGIDLEPAEVAASTPEKPKRKPAGVVSKAAAKSSVTPRKPATKKPAAKQKPLKKAAPKSSQKTLRPRGGA